MQKTEFQVSGYLYKRGLAPGSAWTNRFVTLSLDTGAMKFYVEKSGKRTVKGLVNVKKGRLTLLDQNEVGKPFAFEIVIDELVGKSEDSTMILYALDQSQLDQWKESIESCFTIGDMRRRKSMLLMNAETVAAIDAANANAKLEAAAAEEQAAATAAIAAAQAAETQAAEAKRLEVERLAAEAEAKKIRDAETARLTAEAEVRRAQEVEAKRVADAEAKRVKDAETAARKLAAAEKEEKRQKDITAEKLVKDKETQRLAAEKAEKLAKEVEEQRLAEKNAVVVAEAQRVEAQRVAAEAEMQRIKAAEAEAAEVERVKAVETARIAAEAEAAEVERVKAVEAARVAAEADAQRIASEAAAAQAAVAVVEAQRIKDAEVQRLAAIEEEAKKAEAQRVAAELESTRLKEAEAQRIAAELEAKRQQEEAARPSLPTPAKPPLPSVTTTVLQSSGSALSLDVDGLVDSSYEDSSDEERERVRKASNGSSKATSRNNSKHNVKVVAPSPKAATNSIAASSVTAGSIAASSRQSSFNTLSYTPVSLNSDLMGSDSDVSASAPTNKFGSNTPSTNVATQQQQQSAAELAQVEAHRVAEEKRIADQAADKARAVEQKRLIEEATKRVAEEKKAAAESAQKVEDDAAASSTAVDSEASPKDSESEISAEQKAALLAKVSGAKSYKVPKFKNLLNSNGIDPNDTSPRASLTIPPSERKDFPVPVDPIIVTIPVAPVHVEEETFSTEFHKIRTTKKDRDLSIPVRPTETVRMGYLAKFDTNSKEQGEDAWMTQYCSMDVSAGVLVHFAEINGKRIQRGKFDINANNLYTVDRLFHGKLFSFKITKPPANSSNSSNSGSNTSNSSSSKDKVLPTPAEAKEEEVLVTFAAEDLQSLNYWLLSFEDCALKLEETRAAAKEKEEAEKLALLAAQLEMDKLNQSQRRATADEYNSDSDEDDENDLPIERRHARSKSYTPFMISTETDETAASNATSAANTASNTAHNTPAHSSSQAALLSPKDNKESHHPPVSSLVASAVKTLAKNPSFHFQKRTADSPVVEVEDADHKINSSTLNAAVKALTTKPSFHFPATITVNSKNGSSKQLLVTSSEIDDLFEDITPGFSPAQPSPVEPSLQMHSAAPAIKKTSFNKGSFVAAHCASAPATPHGTDHTHHITQNHHTNQGVEEHKFQNQTAAHTAFNSSSGSVHSLLSKANSASLASLFGPVETVRDDDLDRQLGLETSPPPLPQKRSDVTPLRINTDYSPSPAETHHNQSFGSKNVVMVPVKPVINEDLAQMTFEVKKIRYPAERLCRRIKIWYCSSGFSLSTESSIEQFVTELRNTGDSTLEKFADEKFDNILDWANLLEVLRKYEQRLLLEEAPLDEDDGKSELVSLSVEARVPGRDNRLSFDLDEEYTVAHIAEVIGKEFQFTAEELALQLPTLLTKEGNPLNRGLGMMKDDLTFAEDLILYQEEVIDHLWDSYSKIKALVTQRDEVINQLYTTINTLQDQNKALKEGTHANHSDTFHLPMGSPLSRTPKIKHKPLDGTADRGGGSGRNLEERDFNQIDADGDGQISRDEWRRWIEEKSALIAEHNETKSNLIKEIRTLRKTLNPSTEQSYLELRRSEAAREKLEEELVKAHIQSDSLKTEVASLKQQLQDSESERGLVESDWEERFRALSAQLEEANQALMYQNSNPSLESLAQSTVTPYKDTPYKDSVSFAANTNTNATSNTRTNPPTAGGNTGKPVKTVSSPPAPVPVMSDHGIDRDAASRNIYNFSMELKDNADDDEDYRHYLQQSSSTGQQDTSALWIQKYIYGGGDHNQTLLGSAPADDYTEQQGQWGVTSNDHYSGHYGQQEDLTRSLGNYTSNNPPLVPGRRPSQLGPQQQQRYDLSSSLPASSSANNHNKAPVSNSRVMTRPPLAVNTYDLTGGYTNEFTETGLLVSRSNNAVLADHPLRAALRNDTINKLNGNGKALAQPSRQGFKFTPRGAAQSARKGSQQFGSPGFSTTPMSPNPLDRSRTAGSSPARFMLNTDSWKQKSGADKEIRNPTAMQRNSGGWKFA